MIGLARTKTKATQTPILTALNKIDWSKLTTPQRIDLLRAYQLAFIRSGAPETAAKKSVGERLIGLYPANDRDVNAELCKLISYLEVPGGVTKSLALIAKAPTQEEKIEYAFSLRTVQTGWTLKEREEYFNFFHKAVNFRGGYSFEKFMDNIRADAIKMSLDDEARIALKEKLAVVPKPHAA